MDGRWWLTTDYWCLNANISPSTAVVSNIATLTATLQAAVHTWRKALDVKDVIFMVPLQDEDIKKFAFTWGSIPYTFNGLPQGYKNWLNFYSLSSSECETVLIYR